MTTRDIVSYPCQDACGEIRTDRTVEGAPVLRCPGCDSEWIYEEQRSNHAKRTGLKPRQKSRKR